ADEELAADRRQQAAWLDELRRVGLLRGDLDDTGVDQVVRTLYQYLGRTPARLLALSLADAVGDVRTQNQPGTTDEYPNWRVPLAGPSGEPMQLEDVVASPQASRLAATVRRCLT